MFFDSLKKSGSFEPLFSISMLQDVGVHAVFGAEQPGVNDHKGEVETGRHAEQGVACQRQIAHAQTQGHAHRQIPQAEGPEQVDDDLDALEQIQPQHGDSAQHTVIEEDLQQIHLNDLFLRTAADAYQSGEGQALLKVGNGQIQLGGSAGQHHRFGIGDLHILTGSRQRAPDGLQRAGLSHHQQHQ